jgi:hypothetical protein
VSTNGLVGYGGAFGLATLFPAVAILAIPTRAEVSPDYSRLAGPASSPAAPASSSPS